MVHQNCGGIIAESGVPPYSSEEFGTVPVYECLLCREEIIGDAQIQFIPENRGDEIQIEGIDIDPVCLLHGKRRSENPPHWAGRCLFCCICFKELKSTSDCMSTLDGGYEDVCLECGHEEQIQKEKESQMKRTPTENLMEWFIGIALVGLVIGIALFIGWC